MGFRPTLVTLAIRGSDPMLRSRGPGAVELLAHLRQDTPKNVYMPLQTPINSISVTTLAYLRTTASFCKPPS